MAVRTDALPRQRVKAGGRLLRFLGRHRNGILAHLILLLVSVAIMFPLLVGFFTSFKPLTEVSVYPPRLLPDNWVLYNYPQAWTQARFGRFLVNSVIQSGLITLGEVLFAILSAYAFSVLRWRGRDIVFWIVIATLMVPFELTIIPNFVLISKLNLLNTYWGLSLPFMGTAFGTFLLRQFFLTVPQDLHDAATVDGASSWRYLWQILVPLARSGIGAFAIFSFLFAWNQYLWPLLVARDTQMRTIQIGISLFMSQEVGQNWAVVMAGTMTAVAPTILVFALAQRQLVRGIAMTGLK